MTISTYKEFISGVKRHPENFYIIHYSCQSLNDENEGLSPRITSIAVQHLSTDQTVSFSMHAVAEELRVPKDDVKSRMDEVETVLLREFNEFIRDRRDKYWIHWNMRNLTYGFEHLQHRYRVLTGTELAAIPVERRINLSDMLRLRYGSGYVPHPQLINLMEINGGRHRHFLTGAEEVEAFSAGDYMRMHGSTLCKTGFYRRVINKLISGKLKTKSNSIGVLVDRLLESRIAKVIALTSALFGIMTSILLML
ncbi:MAG: hypothetical protein LAT77_06495 [Aliidiomarina sp.]|uniref:hypothetical protein n=1 Tax=Aliidiomarina sp. TaxID=1872439 RepID=UPI0025BC1408|nr:hypothetical protein [Aliidiomarina sp.]MCH8501544.1 hypothetical protein [Aliidiomarina sp.]